MRYLRLSSSFMLLALLARGDDLVTCALRDVNCALPAEEHSELLFQARVGMELRRPGGPRRDVLTKLLAQGARIKSPMWGIYVLAGCESADLNCSEYLEEATRQASDAAPYLRASSENVRRVIAKEAILEGMDKVERHALYDRALAGLAATQDGITIYRTEAARRAMEEGLLDLVPRIREQMRTWQLDELQEVDRYVTVAEARATRNPARALAQLVRRGATVAAESVTKSKDGVSREREKGIRQPVRLASMALDALRRMGDGSIVSDLKEAIELYRPPSTETGIAEAPSRIAKRLRIVEARAHLGALGVDIAEAIGDLGDRDFERAAVGGRTYWDTGIR